MNEFSQYIKIIGRGHKAGRYLTQQEAYQAMRLIMQGEVEKEQLGAFLMLLRLREETSQELAGFLQATREHTTLEYKRFNADLDLGCYAGKRRHLPWFVLSAILLAQNGYRVFMHGAAEPESTRLHIQSVFEQLNLPVADNGHEAKLLLDRYNLVFSHLELIQPKLYELLQLRPLFGLRSMANTLARMLNPTSAKASMHGVFHRDFDMRHVETALYSEDNHVGCFRGEGGEIEVNPEREFTLYTCENNKINSVQFDALLEKRQIKPAQLDIEPLFDVWQGDIKNDYGEQAVLGTTASYLILLEGLSPIMALEKAKTLWQTRDKSKLSDYSSNHVSISNYANF